MFGRRDFAKREMPTRESGEKDHDHRVWYRRETETRETKLVGPTTFRSLHSDAKKMGRSIFYPTISNYL
jgi:hypothetical protein